jgi:peptide/nickel transport system substrate-binding protein/oligopeptide transport system substrate-binding protein
MPVISGRCLDIKKTSTAVLAAALVAAALILSACSPRGQRLPGYVYYRLAADPFTLDPAGITDVPGGSIAAKLFNGLVRIGKGSLDIVPDIAYKWEISPDGLLYTFHLRKGVKFSNRREVKAADFKYSFERLLRKDTRSPNKWVLEKLYGAKDFAQGRATGIKGITLPDEYTVCLRLEQPFSPFLSLLAMTAAYVVPREAVEELKEEFSSHPVGTGPFTLEKWLPGQELILKARGDYFEGKPHISGMVYRVIPEDLTTVVEFELGNLDVISVPASQYSQFKKDGKWSALMSSTAGLDTYYLGLNCSRPPFNNRKLRQALNYGIDVRKILETYYENRGELARGPVPPALRHWPLESPYRYDPAKARQLIKESGIAPGGLTVKFYITSSQEEVADMAGIIQGELSKLGIRAELVQLEWNTYMEAINKGEPDLFWLSWWADYPDAENFLFPLFDSSNLGPAGNRTWYVNRELDSLVEKGQRARSAARRDGYYARAEELVVEDAPWVFFWHRKDITLRQPWIKNYNVYPVYSMDKGMEISF